MNPSTMLVYARHSILGMVFQRVVVPVGEAGFRYRSLSSVASSMLPIAETMHRQGMTWREISRELGISHTALFNWRRVKLRDRRPREGD